LLDATKHARLASDVADVKRMLTGLIRKLEATGKAAGRRPPDDE